MLFAEPKFCRLWIHDEAERVAVTLGLRIYIFGVNYATASLSDEVNYFSL